MCFAPQRRALFWHRNCQKWSDHGCALYIFTWKWSSRHNGVHFFDIAISKSGPNVVCFVHFHFEMCFAPQQRALFQHLNFQKFFEHGVLCTFWLGNLLRGTTACNFSSLIWPAGSAPAALASLLFDLRNHKSLEKHSVSRLSYLFAHLHLLSPYSFSSTLLSSYLPLLSASSLLCFSSVHIVGSLTSKLPSHMLYVRGCIYVMCERNEMRQIWCVCIYIYIYVCVCVCYMCYICYILYIVVHIYMYIYILDYIICECYIYMCHIGNLLERSFANMLCIYMQNYLHIYIYMCVIVIWCITYTCYI